MAEIKITELNELSKASLNDNDVLPIVDISDDETKKIKISNIKTDSLNEYNTSQIQPYSANYSNTNFQTREVELYNDETGTNGDVTLSDSAANYTYIKIYFRDNDNGRNSVEIYSPNGTYASLMAVSPSGDNAYMKMRVVYINGTSITNKNNSSFAEFRTSSPNTSATNYIYITRVVGIN